MGGAWGRAGGGAFGRAKILSEVERRSAAGRALLYYSHLFRGAPAPTHKRTRTARDKEREREGRRHSRPTPHMSASTAAALRARLGALAERAASAAAPVTRAASAELDKVLAANAEYVVKDPVAASKLGRQWLFTSLAR